MIKCITSKDRLSRRLKYVICPFFLLRSVTANSWTITRLVSEVSGINWPTSSWSTPIFVARWGSTCSRRDGWTALLTSWPTSSSFALVFSFSVPLLSLLTSDDIDQFFRGLAALMIGEPLFPHSIGASLPINQFCCVVVPHYPILYELHLNKL